MTFQFTLLENSLGLELPQSMVAWGMLFLYLIVIYWRLSYWQRDPHRQQTVQASVFAFLFILVPITTLFLVFRGDLTPDDPNSLYSLNGTGFSLPLFAAVPWMLAAGLLNPLHSVLLGFVSGSIISVFSTHSLFTPFEFASISLIFSELIRTHYRGWFFRFVRSPLGGSIFVGFLFVILVGLNGVLTGSNNLVAFIPANPIWSLTAFGLILFVMAAGGFICLVVSKLFGHLWVKPGFLLPVPDEKLITRRFLTGIGPFIFALLILLVVGIWWTAGYSGRMLVKERMAGSAEVAANSIPFFTNTGQNMILQAARTLSASENSEKDIQILLSQNLNSVQFFNQILYVNSTGKPIVSVPESELSLSTSEQTGLQQAAQGLLYGKYVSFSGTDKKAATISFIAPVKDKQSKINGYLIGRTDLASNSSMQPVITLLNGFSGRGGEGYIIDDQGIVIYHPQAKYLQSSYPGELAPEERFFTLQSAEGSPLMVYYRPSPDHDWSVILALPAGEVQNETWRLALPLVLMVLLVTALVYLVIRSGLTSITHAVRQLTNEAERISKGQLDHMQYIRGEDEIGKLGLAFEQMRMSLKDQVDELSLLLKVSQGIASNLQIEDAVQPILVAAMSNGGSAARIVLVPDPSLDPINTVIERYGGGEMNGHYQYLDDQVLALTRNRDSITLNNLMRGRALKLNPEVLNPSAIISIPLRHEGHFLGILWVSYDQPRTFSDEENQFLNNLSEDVSRALANIRLYRTAELGRQRLEAILNSTPDPTFVMDSSQRIILANPSAVELFDTREFFIEGKTIDEAVHSSVLLDLIRTGETNKEIRFPNHKVFFAYQSNMILDGALAGRMCILRDITHFKEVDSLKTEFVATVSHDLRAPLTLMRGNATMLQMVGELNEQQKNYVKKIISGIESMTSLVNNLLDLGRIEAGMALQLSPVRAILIVNKVISTLALQANQKNIQVTSIPEEGSDPEVHADQALVEQALYNLVENGIKFTPVGGNVTISIKDHGSKVVFEVKDTGIGIAPLDIPKLFEKFFRMSQRDGFFQKGSSLGLSIVKSIAERHGGRVWVDSQLGRGSTFYLEVPAFQRIVEDLPEELES